MIGDRLVCGRRVCRHPRYEHRHWRHGRDCGECGDQVCPRFHIPWGLLVLDYGGWLLVPPIAVVTWHAARDWSLATFVGIGTALCVATGIAGVVGRWLGSEIAEQHAAGARIRDLPAYWWAVAHHRIGDHDPMTLLDEHTRLDPPDPDEPR